VEDASDFEATVALPDSPGAQAAVPGPQPLGAPHPVAGPAPLGGQALGPPPLQAAALAPSHERQATRRSLPRPEGVADFGAPGQTGQVAVDPADVALDGPRSLVVLLLIALLATICTVGVGAILFYKLRQPASHALVAPSKPAAEPVKGKSSN